MLPELDTARVFAKKLLQIKAIQLNLQQPFTWASGWRSPIYCDNRLTLSYPELRTYIKTRLAEGIKAHFKGTELIAGVATAGIAHGALLADLLGLPFVYVRSKAKEHGQGKRIEGKVNGSEKTVVVEDLISTGRSSLQAVETLREAGCTVSGMVALFTYGFDVAKADFQAAGCPYYTLSDYPTLIDTAVQEGHVTAADLEVLEAWRTAPGEWET